jgi:anti-sigma B factor antagonist
MEGIQVSTEVAGSQNQISIIKVGGFIDTTTSSEVERALNSLLKQNRYHIVIDLGNVDYISSAGWGIFISEIKSIRENNGDLKLVRMIPDVYEIFELLEFHHILDVYDSVEEAVEKIEQASRKPEAVSVGQETGRSRSSIFDEEEETMGVVSDKESRPTPKQEAFEEQDFTPSKPRAKEYPLAMRSLEEKVKFIVANAPNLGAYKINKILNSDRFGYTKVGWFGVRSLLSQLGLNSRKNRKKFSQRYKEKLA